MLEPTRIILDFRPIEAILESNIFIGGIDRRWLTGVAVVLWEHSYFYPDAEDDLIGWLRVRLPELWNEQICALASYYGTTYIEEFVGLVDIIKTTVFEIIDIIEREYSTILNVYIYDYGWTLSRVDMMSDAIVLLFHRTKIDEIQSASESLYARLEMVGRR